MGFFCIFSWVKRFQYIFVFLFLGSMLFTLFQYAPILEEEIQVSKTLTKKTNDPSTENDSDDDTDPDSDDADEFFREEGSGVLTLYSSFHRFHPSHSFIFNSSLSIQTPPPKI
jgi:hypothetical protein